MINTERLGSNPMESSVGTEDERVKKVIGKAISFLPKTPQVRDRIDAAVTYMELRDGVGRLVYPKEDIIRAIREADIAALVKLSEEEPHREILVRAAPIDPWLREIILNPVQNYASLKGRDKVRFRQERRFLTSLLCDIPSADIETYLRNAIKHIDFRNPAMTSLTSPQRQNILLSIFKQHLVFCQSFSQIRSELTRKLEKSLPGESVFSKYYGTLIFMMVEKWSQYAQSYHLYSRVDCVISSQEALRRLSREEKRTKRLKDILEAPSVPLSMKVAIRALSSTTRLDILAQRTPYLKRTFSQVMGERIEENPEYMPALELIRIIDFFFFSENMWMIPENHNPLSFYKKPHQVFYEAAQVAETLSPANCDRLRLQAFQALVRFIGLRGIRDFLASLPGKADNEKIKMVELLQKEAPPDLELKETTVGVYVRGIAAAICEIMDGPSVWGPEMMDKSKLPELIFRKSKRRRTSDSALLQAI